MNGILFVDSTVPNYQNLIQGLNADTQVVILDPNQDGILQITEALKSGIFDTVHIVSHGTQGNLQLGTAQLNAATVPTYSHLLGQWSNYLAPGADILLYGCNVAQGNAGQNFVQQLHQVTGADIAASDDATGSVVLGGDWDLEYSTGTITAPLAFQIGAMAAYNSVLAPFTAGNLVVVRVNNEEFDTASAVFLDEYNTTNTGQTALQSINLPTSDSGRNQTFTLSNYSFSEGGLNLSTNRRYLTLAGYDAAPGTANITENSRIQRVVARVDFNGVIDTTTTFSNNTPIFSAVTDDGTRFWTGSAYNGNNTSGISYTILGSSTNQQISVVEATFVSIFNGQLYTSYFNTIDTVGSGLPTTSGQITTEVVSSFGELSAYTILDRNPGVPGLDTLYAADLFSGLLKFSFDGTNWTDRGSIDGSLTGLTGVINGSSVDLYATDFESNSLLKFTDTTAFDADISGSFTTLATAPANTSFRGVAFAPTPPPLSDLTISLSDSPDPVTVGNNLTYTLTVNNSGAANASGVAVDFTLPSGLSVVGVPGVSNGFTYAGTTGGVAKFSGGNINTSSSATLTVQVTPNTPGTLTSGTAIVDPNNTITESNESNNSAAAIATTVNVPPRPDLNVGIITPGPLYVGTPFNYTLNVQNNGTANASGIELRFTLPANLTYNSANILGGGFSNLTVSGSTLTFTGGSINAGSFAQINVNVTPTQAGTLGTSTLVADPNNTITESNEANNSISTSNVTVNPAPTVNLSVSSNTGSEAGTTVITVTATASNSISGSKTVNLAVTGTGITASDYILSNTTITIPSGQTTGSVTFTVVDDAVFEGTETATLTIRNPSANITLGSTTTQNITITDNDTPPPVNLSVNTNAGTEAGTTIITVTATAASAVSGNQTVNLGVSGTGITASDYYLSNPTITIANGQTSGSVSFIVADDAIAEGTETAILTISNPSAGISLGTTTSQNISITNNDTSFLIKVGSATSANGAEIPAFDPVSDRLFVVAGNTVEIYTVSNTGTLTAAGSLTPTLVPPPGIELIPNSVAVKNGVVAVAEAIRNTTTGAQLTGQVSFYDAANGTSLNAVFVGVLPDMLTFTPDGTKVLVANEGEPNSYGQGNSVDPEGSVSIIDISGGVANATVQTATFTSFNSQIASLKAAGVRIIGPGATVAQDVEPEYIAVAADGLTARITLQENNAVAILDIASATITQILPLGAKNHNLPGNGLDASDQDGGINIRNWPIFGLYQPDAIASFTVSGQTYYITANEGDSRNYTGFNEEVRVGNASYVLDPTAFPNATLLKQNTNLGRLQLTNATGDTDGDGDIDRIEAFGARSFSIWNSNGTQVFDSGDQLEQITAAKTPTLFNSDGAAATFDTRSDNKGPEPEGVTVGVINNRTYAFIGLERTGDVMVYDVTNPNQPQFIQYINTPEDIAPEGLTFISAADSPTGRPLLVTANEVSRTVAVFAINLPGVTITESGGSTNVAEGGATDTYTVKLDSQPTGVVTISINPGNQLTTSTNTLTFTANNWNVEQTVTVTAVDDTVVEGSHTATITHAIANSGTNYDSLIIPLITVNITDNDTPPITGTSGNDILTGTNGNDTINGLEGNDYLIGNAGNDTLNCGTGNDYGFGGAGDDTINGNDGNDLLYGNEGNDTLNGGEGNDNLDGGPGNDTLIGGNGNDTYTVDSLNDNITETATGGTRDKVNSSITWTLGENLENLTLIGRAAINGTGNSLNNQIFGNDASNTLDGGDGNDWLVGQDGDDTLIGGAGNDRLDGGKGNDNFNGGAGDDIYEIDSVNDVITEAANEGTDTVISSVELTLAVNFENLTLVGTANLNGTGNDVSNRLVGNGSNNTLTGLIGNDYLSGEGGNDTLVGGSGNDTLVGGSGVDTFDLTASLSAFDTILDFQAGETVLLSGSEFGLSQAGTMDASLFRLGSTADNSTQRFIYNQATGALSFDSDGSGATAQVQIALFSNRVALSNTNFTFISEG
ncbi:choice-of-anchor I family protein [Nostoc sp. TCL26-01]|uniref:choice-of-anchor I family protein n=1 Tax=Nostoc sp. TCL26-01 TaxID=2576904 RepID=UPI0015BF71E9|nr:choice-of-anchor I family protein [Nostoc sp. TCL26-01]QLE55490.1 DUF4347 domain-containing protein [Nostoc sp. TCL26-01]